MGSAMGMADSFVNFGCLCIKVLSEQYPLISSNRIIQSSNKLDCESKISCNLQPTKLITFSENIHEGIQIVFFFLKKRYSNL